MNTSKNILASTLFTAAVGASMAAPDANAQYGAVMSGLGGSVNQSIRSMNHRNREEEEKRQTSPTPAPVIILKEARPAQRSASENALDTLRLARERGEDVTVTIRPDNTIDITNGKTDKGASEGIRWRDTLQNCIDTHVQAMLPKSDKVENHAEESANLRQRFDKSPNKAPKSSEGAFAMQNYMAYQYCSPSRK